MPLSFWWPRLAQEWTRTPTSGAYDLVGVEDGCEAFSEEAHHDGLDYLENVYGAEIAATADIVNRWETAEVAA